MFKKSLLLVSLLSIGALSACGGNKNYTAGDPLTLTSIEMADEYGDATLIQYGNYDILVDSGSEQDASHVNAVLTNKVKDKTIDLLVVTHPHGDHIGGIINNALNGFSVNKIVDYGYVYNTSGTDKITNSAYVQRYADKKAAFISAGAEYHGIKEEMAKSNTLVIDKANDLTLRWLKNDNYFGEDEVFPNSKSQSENPNTTSVAFCLEYKYWNIVMMGDADSTIEEASIVKNHEKLFKDEKKKVLLKGTHHCSSSSMGYTLLNWCSPDMIFTSSAMISSICVPNQVALGSGTGELNHPNKSTVRRIKQTCENFYWNGICGDMTFVTDGVNDMTMTGAGRNRDYYVKGSDTIASRDNEKNVTLFNSAFYEYYK